MGDTGARREQRRYNVGLQTAGNQLRTTLTQSQQAQRQTSSVKASLAGWVDGVYASGMEGRPRIVAIRGLQCQLWAGTIHNSARSQQSRP